MNVVGVHVIGKLLKDNPNEFDKIGQMGRLYVKSKQSHAVSDPLQQAKSGLAGDPALGRQLAQTGGRAGMPAPHGHGASGFFR